MSGGTEFKDAAPTYRKLTFQYEPPPYRFIEADIRRACKAAPDRTIGDRYRRAFVGKTRGPFQIGPQLRDLPFQPVERRLPHR
jgi:hypothetical protein